MAQEEATRMDQPVDFAPDPRTVAAQPAFVQALWERVDQIHPVEAAEDHNRDESKVGFWTTQPSLDVIHRASPSCLKTSLGGISYCLIPGATKLKI